MAHAKTDPDKLLDDLIEGIVATARYTHTPMNLVADMPRSIFRRVAKALDKIITAENKPRK